MLYSCWLNQLLVGWTEVLLIPQSLVWLGFGTKHSSLFNIDAIILRPDIYNMVNKNIYTLSGPAARKILDIFDLILQCKNQNHILFWWILQALVKKLHHGCHYACS